MKKFTAVVESIREINEKELSDLQKSYREYFGAKMKKFGVKSPAELDDAQKKEFFNEITKDWEKGQGASEAGKKDVEEHGVKESEDVNESTLEIAGGVILGILGLKTIAAITKGVIGTLKIRAMKDPAKLKQLVDELSDRAMVSKRNPLQVALWDTAVKSMIDSGEIKNGLDLMKTFKGMDEIDISKVFEEEGIDMSDESVTESEEVNEKEIKTAEEFKAFAEDKLKKQHGDDFDQDKADKVIKGLSDEAEKSDDWGAAVGKLNKA